MDQRKPRNCLPVGDSGAAAMVSAIDARFSRRMTSLPRLCSNSVWERNEGDASSGTNNWRIDSGVASERSDRQVLVRSSGTACRTQPSNRSVARPLVKFPGLVRSKPRATRKLLSHGNSAKGVRCCKVLIPWLLPQIQMIWVECSRLRSHCSATAGTYSRHTGMHMVYRWLISASKQWSSAMPVPRDES